MNTIELADQSLCTGCGACAARCPKHCISMRENAVGIVLPVIDTTACIGCHTCEKACPILKTPEPHMRLWGLRRMMTSPSPISL